MAEKPSISKAVSGHLSGGQYQTVISIRTKGGVPRLLTSAASATLPISTSRTTHSILISANHGVRVQ